MSSIPSTASTSQEGHESNSGSTSSRKLRVTLLSSEWRSTKGGLSTINRELAIQLAKHPSVEVSVYLPECSEDDKRVATSHNVHLIEAEKMPGLGPDLWLSCLPEDHAVDCVIGHGAVLGRQVQIIKRHHHCKWIQVVHTSPEEVGMYKEHEKHISRAEEKHQVEVELCKSADQVVAVGTKLADAFSGYLRPCGKDQDVLNLTPGIFSEFADVSQAAEERNSFNVLVFGRGDSEDFQLKGYDIAAQAIAELKDTTYKLVFVGATRGEEEKVARKLVEQGIDPSQLKERHLNENGKKLADLFCEVDLAVMPSRTEGFGLAALEALSAGLPVLVSGNSGLAEALKKVPHGSSCVVESEDPKDWANAIRTVRHKDREMRLGEFDFVRRAYAKKYSWKEQCDKLVERMKVISSEDSSKRPQSLDKGKRPLSPSDTSASKQPRLLRYAERASETSATDPPQVSARQIRNKDLPAKSKPFGDCQIEVDILLLTVMKEDTCEDCEFLSCLAYLNPDFCKIHHPDLGYVYLGDMGEDDLKLNVAVMKCCEGSSSTGGSIVVVTNAVKVLKPKAVFCVGSCSGLNVTKVCLGDVVVLKKLVTYAFSKVTENGIEERGVKVPLKPQLSKLILSAGEGWKPPLKDPGTLEVRIHRGTFLSGPEVINNHKRCNALIERFPEAVAIEREGEGVYAAAHNLDIEWVVIKGISGYADGRKVKDSWRAFASFMAASLTAHILSDTIAFQALPHYGSASSSGGLQPVKKGKTPLPPSGIPDPKHPRLSKDEVSGAKRSKSSKKGKRPLSSSNTPKHPRLLRDEVSGAKRSKSSKKGKRPLSSSTTPKHPRLLRDEGSAKKRQSSKNGKRPLSSRNIPAPKYLRPLEDEGSKKGKRPSGGTPASKVPKCLGDEGGDSLVLVKLLKKEYNRRSHLRPLLWDSTIQLPIEQVYTRLKIVSRGKLAIQMEGDEVNVFDIFKAPGIGEDVMTIVEGSPGIGKTTFCLKLAYDWAHGNIPSECSFPKFEFVFLLKCRDIDGDIMESISEQLLPRDMEKSVEKLLHLLKDIRDQERLMLIILDGLDELPEKSRHHVDELLERRILGFCYVLATTRQERGIEVRKSFVFDVHLEIKGYTESDSITYVRRHFETIDQSPKGERLIEEMEQNTFLHALRSNPLNLLLLCVVYEDCEGKLPTSQTELYQVIVQCLLRRYCAKHSLAVPEDRNSLQKRFEEDVLALGQLAWTCLLNDRQSFPERELAQCEVKNQNLVARKIGLLYMEESRKRINPQHEYWFLHKTFQEYLAAAFVTQKLLRGEFVFEYTTFIDLFGKYQQVFLFVSGMLGEKATVLFTQIGEKLKEYGWDWNDCSKPVATFFVKSFSETGHAEKMAITLCGAMPFPQVLLIEGHHLGFSFAKVLIACESFLNLQTPVQLEAAFKEMSSPERGVVIRCIESLSKLESVSLNFTGDTLISEEADHLRKWLCLSKSLSEFTFKSLSRDINYDALVLLCNGLASCKTLRKVKFSMPGENSEKYIKAVETGLSPDTPLTSAVVLKIYGSISFSAIQALHKVLSNKSLKSLSLDIFGDVKDLLAGAISEALARQTVLKSIYLCLGGKLSSAGASSLKKGLLKNRSLNYFKVVVFGELPDNWQSVVETLYSTKKSPVSCVIHPNTLDNIGHDDVGLLLAEKALVPKQQLTVNVWGKLSCEGADVLCEILIRSSLNFKLLTLNVHGNVTEDVANSVARCLKRCNILFLLSIHIWGSLTPEGGTILSELSKSNLCVNLNVHHVHLASEESNQVLDICIENPAALRAFFTKVNDTRKEKVSLTINNISSEIGEWTHHLAEAFAENTSPPFLYLTVNSHLTDCLLESLLQSTSIKFLSLAIDFRIMDGLLCKLGACFAKMASLTTLSLKLNDNSDGTEYLEGRFIESEIKNVLVSIKSLSTLSVTVHNERMDSFWKSVLGDCLRECTSLRNLCYAGKNMLNLGDGLAVTTSLKTLDITFNWNDIFCGSVASFAESLSLNESLTTLSVTVSLTFVDNFYYAFVEDKTFLEGLSKNRSITTLNFTIDDFGKATLDIAEVFRALGVFHGLAQNTSITTFNLTVSGWVAGYWLRDLCYALNQNSSLTTLRLKVNNRCALYDFSNLSGLRSRSLSILELEVSFYGKREQGSNF